MLNAIENNLEQIAAICRLRGVKQLELFGSAARDDFDPETSDLDFFVEFKSYDDPAIADHWFGLEEDLAALFKRKVDLISPTKVWNPYFLKSANLDRISIYAA